MRIDEIVTEMNTIIARDSDGFQWTIGEDLSYDDAKQKAQKFVDHDAQIYVDAGDAEVDVKNSSEWTWRVHSPKYDYTFWVTIYKQSNEQEDELGEGLAWKRRGNKVVKQFRCTSGQRAGRVVASPSQCFKPIDIKKRLTMRKMKAKMGGRAARKSNRTKKFNPVSKRAKSMNHS